MATFGKFLLAVPLLAACATGNESLDPKDGGVRDAPLGFADAEIFLDAKPQPDVYRAPDSRVQQEFNQPCGDRGDCTSGLCLISGIGGYCTMTCEAGTCPPGFGCLGVSGIAEPGQITFVCVRESSLLCSPCSMNSECAATSNDLCLPSAAGGSFCGRDCSVIDCPTGYQCQQVAAGDAGTAKQCVPQSGACDCDATDTGHTKACTLDTPFGPCTASRTCLGSAGWGDCKAAAADVPDGNFADENCDGIDGTVTDGVFVATAPNGGADTDGCGPGYLNPCATISTGARHAKLLGKHYVYVQAGVYNETVVMTDGVSIFGGYDLMWQRADRTRPGHTVQIIGVLYPTDDQFAAIVAHDLTQPTILADVILTGGNAGGSSSRSGRSSYGVHAKNAKLTVQRVTINAGKGADGQNGATGPDAPGVFVTEMMKGKVGDDASQGISVCDSDSRGNGGGVGSNTCVDHGGDNPTGGTGGSGGTKDTSCSAGCLFGDCTATDGNVGIHATVFAANQYGYGGAPAIGERNGNDVCGLPGKGGDGLVTNGPGGPGGDGGGRLLSGYWYAFPGADGQAGKNGGGGGGGGGSSGCDSGTDSYGAGGGGGGAGGCAAQAGGGGGEGGGGSFAVFAVGSTLTLADVTVTQANGGRGGDGGTGGRGQDGGPGGSGGNSAGGSKMGGLGGAGGHGGHGGGGGGGAGGVSYGVFTTSDTTLQLQGTNLITDGGISGGGPGGPGASAPSAPAPGSPGTIGTAGTEAKTFVCANPAHC